MKMKRIDDLNIHTIRQWHQAEKWEEAHAGYLALLEKNPRDAEALHSLGVLCAQQEKFSEAIHYLELAIQEEPNHFIFYLHLANILKITKQWERAITVLQNLLTLSPDYAPALNNIGNVYYEMGKMDAAVDSYRQAIEKKSDYIDAYYNLALSLTKKNKLDEAVSAYQALLSRAPAHFAARFHLASVFMRQNRIKESIEAFLIVEEVKPHHVETQLNLAACYTKQGKIDEAKIHYTKALAIHPDDIDILFNLGTITMQQGDMDNAIRYYQRTLKLNADHFAAHNNVGIAFLARNHVDFALVHFKEALRLQPDNIAVDYVVNALMENQQIVSAPPDYLTSLFDAYADHYDIHLKNALDYQVPELFLQRVTTMHSKNNKLDILDLGCGTGLCGELLKSFSKTLTGVDLSQKMLDRAAQKNQYDRLIKNTIVDFLTEQKKDYDLILAGDVLVYTGDLDALFSGVKNALRQNGFFIFNAEITEKKSFFMNQSGRFAHHKEYLDALAEKYQFELVSYHVAITRLQNNEPVYGHIYVLRYSFTSPYFATSSPFL